MPSLNHCVGMAMIYYKFKSQKEFKALQFEALVISVSDLRRRLCNLIKLRRGDGLLIFNSQTNEGLFLSLSETFSLVALAGLDRVWLLI